MYLEMSDNMILLHIKIHEMQPTIQKYFIATNNFLRKKDRLKVSELSIQFKKL